MMNVTKKWPFKKQIYIIVFLKISNTIFVKLLFLNFVYLKSNILLISFQHVNFQRFNKNNI